MRATGHINPTAAAHGRLHPDGPDSGDLPNLYVAADLGTKAEFSRPGCRLWAVMMYRR